MTHASETMRMNPSAVLNMYKASEATMRRDEVGRIAIPEGIREQLAAAIEHASPLEVCGLLAGQVRDGTLMVQWCHVAQNTFRSPRRFGLTMQDLSWVPKHTIGIRRILFHSHPRRTHPSRRDLNGIRRSPDPWLIVTLSHPPEMRPCLVATAYIARRCVVHHIPVTIQGGV